jgi:hypothetical protein
MEVSLGEGAEISLEPVISRDAESFFRISPTAFGPSRHVPSPNYLNFSRSAEQGDPQVLRLLD